MRAVGGRNFTSGVVMAVLSLTGRTRVAGTMMICGLITQAIDTMACVEVGGNWQGHAFLAPITGAIGWWIARS